MNVNRLIMGLGLAFLPLGVLPRAWAEPERKPVLIELFTSEGCSSCPPADAFLRKLDSEQPVAGSQLIVLEEHVDYWDDQGWRDPHSSHEITLRQTFYSRRFHLDGPYTPEMVVDGAYEFVGNDQGRAATAIEKAKSLPSVAVRILAPQVDRGKLKAQVETDPVPQKADVMVAVALDHAESQVKAGENSGRHLEHAAVVKEILKIGTADPGKGFSRNVSVSGCGAQACRLIVFLQQPNQGKVIGAALQHIKP